MADLVYRQNRITRATHWINAIALIVLFMSGLQIFNAFPRLHWGDTTDPEEAFLSIAATNDDGEVRGYTELFGYRIDTTGFLGVQNTDLGPAPRAFPSWLTIPGFFWLAGGRRWHFFFAWIFALNGLLYVIYNIANGHMRKFLLGPRDAALVPAMALYYLRLRKESPQQGEYNPLQKVAYTGVFLILTPLIMLSGLAMSPQLNMAFNWLPAMFGGRQSARSIHFILTFLFAGFTFGHVFMALSTGALNNMRSILTGWYKEKLPHQEEPVGRPHLVEEIIKPPVSTARSRESSATPVETSPVGKEHPAGPQAAEDNGIANSESANEQSVPEPPGETSPQESKEAKKNVGE
ncbi:MAG: cytochrome b/b6 domain-containing protein [Candidatus Binatia bacterium]